MRNSTLVCQSKPFVTVKVAIDANGSVDDLSRAQLDSPVKNA